MVYDNYDKMSDIIFSFDNNTHLIFNINLKYEETVKDKKNFISVHQEFERKNKIMIRRKPNYYFSIERFYFGKFRITLSSTDDWYFFKQILNQAIEWYTKDSILRTMQNNDLKFTKTVEPLQIKISYGKYIGIEPILVTSKIPGFRIYIETQEQYIDIALNKMLAFVDMMSKFNVLEYGAIMMNYVNPGLGYNQTSFSYNNDFGGDNV